MDTQPPAPTPALLPPATPRKRKSRKKTGDEAEIKAVDILEAQGYRVMRAWPFRVPIGAGKWIVIPNKSDFFGAFDIIATKHGERPRYIQVTADSGIGRKVADVTAVPLDPAHASVEVWMWKGKPQAECKDRTDYRARQHFQVRRFDAGFSIGETVAAVPHVPKSKKAPEREVAPDA